MELGTIANLVELQVPDNQLTGEIPVELGSLAKLGTSLSPLPEPVDRCDTGTELGSLAKLERTAGSQRTS